MGPTEIMAERENIYKLLAQTTKENMSKAISKVCDILSPSPSYYKKSPEKVKNMRFLEIFCKFDLFKSDTHI